LKSTLTGIINLSQGFPSNYCLYLGWSLLYVYCDYVCFNNSWVMWMGVKLMMIVVVIIIQFNSLLFMCRVNSHNNNNFLLQYCHMKNFTSSSHYILLRESVILYFYWYIFNPFMVFVLKLWMTKYSGIQHCMLLLYPCCMHICNDFLWLVPTMLGAFVLIFLDLLYLTHSKF
jgi:hypothetical protein